MAPQNHYEDLDLISGSRNNDTIEKNRNHVLRHTDSGIKLT